VTQLERNGAGQLTAIVSPFGQRTTIGLDANGYLSALTNPANETIHIQHDVVGLLRTLADAKGNPPHQFVYDSLGQLTRDTDPASAAIAGAPALDAMATVTTALGARRRMRCSILDGRRVVPRPIPRSGQDHDNARTGRPPLHGGWHGLSATVV
jgi:YD repeat-containing protein